MPPHLRKYPRTHHLEGSRSQPGDEDLDSVPFTALRGQYIVVEEKLDGANAGLSLTADGSLWLQSRGHFLTGGGRERHFNLFKQWAHTHVETLRRVVRPGLVVYGEWLYAKHTVFYDRLPHYFLEFDIYDPESDEYWSTDRRHALFAGTPVAAVPVLWRGQASSLAELVAHVGPSRYKSPQWRENLAHAAASRGQDPAKVLAETDPSDAMEGLYIKVEAEGRVVARYKYVRASFLTAVVDSGTHWLNRPIVPNQLAEGVEIAGGSP